MSGKGNCYDNANMESFFGTLKAEHPMAPSNEGEARLGLFDYIETFYNTKRIHTSLGGLTPSEFEAERREESPEKSEKSEPDASCARPSALEFFEASEPPSTRMKDSPPGSEEPGGSDDSQSVHSEYPSASCSPAELTSVSSPQETANTSNPTINPKPPTLTHT